MSSKQEVYIVTSGEYSDYRIEAVFTDKALAERHAERLSGSVETCALLTRKPVKRRVYSVAVNEAGEEVNRYEQLEWSYEARFGANVRTLRSRIVSVIARSPRGYDVALKVARDALAKAKAERAGL